MINDDDLREIKANINAFVGRSNASSALGRSMEEYSSLKTTTPVVNAFHEAQVCTGQNIEALLKLDMVLEDLLTERLAR
jgi:hypothetical protein